MQQRKSTPRRYLSTSRCDREGGLDKPQVHRGVAKLHHGEGLCRSVVVLRLGVATAHSMETFVFFVLFCFSVASRTCLLD